MIRIGPGIRNWKSQIVSPSERAQIFLEILSRIVIFLYRVILSINYFEEKGNSPQTIATNPRREGDRMDPKLVKQFIYFLVILFGWTVVILLVGPK